MQTQLLILICLLNLIKLDELDQQVLKKNEETYSEFVKDIHSLSESDSLKMIEQLVGHTQSQLEDWDQLINSHIDKIHNKTTKIQRLEIQYIFNIDKYINQVNLKQMSLFILMGWILGTISVIMIHKVMVISSRMKYNRLSQV